MSAKRFESKVVIVTGGANGIGAACVRAFAAEGARVAILDIDGPSANELAGDEANILAQITDIADRGAVDAAIAEVTGAWAGIDVLVNNAGTGAPGNFADLTDADWRRIYDVNVTGAFNCTQAALPHMKGRPGANVINVSSVAGRRLSYFGGAQYSSSKAALLGLTRHCAFELAVYGIRVNSVSPGPTVTAHLKRNMSPEIQAETAAGIPLDRMCEPEEIAGPILFLASPDAAMMTGANLDVDGGFLIAHGTDYQAWMARRGIEAQ